MPIRIYALAKELKFDSKELVDLCVKAGIPNKGSALASLDDDEVVKLKAFLANRNKPRRPDVVEQPAHPPVLPPAPRPAPAPVPAARPAAPPPPVPAPEPEIPAPVVEAPVITPARPAPLTPAPTPAPVAEAVPSEVSAVAAAPTSRLAQMRQSAPGTTPIAPRPAPLAPAARHGGTATTTAAPAAPQRRDESMPLSREMGRIRVIGPRKKEGEEGTRKPEEGGAPRKDRDPAPGIRLAAIPQNKAPAAEKKAAEPAAQKPIMRLPEEAIKTAKQGKSAPLERIKQQQENKRKLVGPPAAGASSGTSSPAKPTRRRGGKDVPEEEPPKKALAGMAGTREARQQNRKRGVISLSGDDEDSSGRRRRPRHKQPKQQDVSAPRKTNVSLVVPCTVRQFSEAAGVPVAKVLRSILALGTMANVNFVIERDLAEYLAAEHDVQVDFKSQETLEESLINVIEDEADTPESLVSRPPIVTFLGHVDHGKTSLLDRLIGTNVVKGEAGGITQHIRAYQIEKDGRKISFVDTPGHEAFTEMRARGANVTDIAVLVVAADDGIMPQTEEAISHARAAGVPIVVAMNKMDLPTANEQKVLQELAAKNLLATEWGGDVEVIRTSATTGLGMDSLLETLLLTAELHELKANPDRPAVGTCLEAEQHGDIGVMAKIMVQNGTLRVGDVIVCGGAHGRVKAMYDTLHPTKKIDEAGPSTPVNLVGLDLAPAAGDRFHVLDDIGQAREIARQRSHTHRTKSLSGFKAHISFDEFQKRREGGKFTGEAEVTTLNIVLRADTRGSIEAIEKELAKFDHPEVRLNLLQAAVGGITVGDVTLADASDAVILGFNVIPDETARMLAEDRGVEIRRYDIIYKLTEEIKLVIEGKLKPEEVVKEMGRALVLRVFTISRVGTVAGCRVLSGTIDRSCKMRVNRESRGIGEYSLDSLKREKDDAREVREGLECGIKLAGFNDLKEGDVLEAFKIEEVARTL